MKLYHVETQEDYDTLMIELDEQGYKWSNYKDIFYSNEWLTHKSETVVNANDNKKELLYSRKEFYQTHYPNEEIITYKATKKERTLGIPSWAEWLARGEYGKLWAFAGKPSKGIWGLAASGGRFEVVKETDDTFKSIRWEDEEPTRVTDFIANTKKEVASEQDKNGKDLYQKWYEEHDIQTFRAIMRAVAERYTSRYEKKNGIEDLKEGIYTLERLREYEERDAE